MKERHGEQCDKPGGERTWTGVDAEDHQGIQIPALDGKLQHPLSACSSGIIFFLLPASCRHHHMTHATTFALSTPATARRTSALDVLHVNPVTYSYNDTSLQKSDLILMHGLTNKDVRQR